MSHASRPHRALDRQLDQALAEDAGPLAGHGLVPSRQRGADARSLATRVPEVLLAELWERESARGTRYFSGFLGAASVVLLFEGERDHSNRPGEKVKVWRLVAQERQRQRQGRTG